MVRYVLGLIWFLAGTPALAGGAFDLVSRQTEAAQLKGFAGVIRSSGAACGAASRHFYMGESAAADAGFWTVRCDSGDFIVQVSNVGTMRTTVLGCTVAEAAGVRCWRPF